MTMNARSIRQEDSDVMKQSRFLQKSFIQLQFRMTVGYPKRLVRHRTAMSEQYMFQFIVYRIIFIDDCQCVHIEILFLCNNTK